MAKKDIVSVNDLSLIMDLFEGGAKLISVNYVSCTQSATVNDVKTARLSFMGKKKFDLEFGGVDCVHIVPIAMGSIMLSDIAVGKFGSMVFWADDSSFNVSEPDSSLSYVIARTLSVIC